MWHILMVPDFVKSLMIDLVECSSEKQNLIDGSGVKSGLQLVAQ